MKSQVRMWAVAAAAASSMFGGSAFAIACENNDVLGAIDCVGLFSGNANSTAAFPTYDAQVEAGLGVTGLTFTGANVESFSAAVGGYSTMTFSQELFGPTVVGIHWGNYSGFYLLDLAAPPYSIQVENGNGALILSNAPGTGGGLSNGHIYSTTPVPEPETYALMLAGLGLVGFMARRRRQA
jgi:PEP-CTERM motif